MKPTEHEFKVMGMAGYGVDKTNFYEKAIRVFQETLGVNDITVNASTVHNFTHGFYVRLHR